MIAFGLQRRFGHSRPVGAAVGTLRAVAALFVIALSGLLAACGGGGGGGSGTSPTPTVTSGTTATSNPSSIATGY